MNLIKINYDEFKCVNVTEEKIPLSDYMHEFSDVFDQHAVGNLPGNVQLVLEDECTPCPRLQTNQISLLCNALATILLNFYHDAADWAADWAADKG